MGSLFESAGFSLPGVDQPAAPPAADASSSLFKDAGFSLPGQKAKPAGTNDRIYNPLGPGGSASPYQTQAEYNRWVESVRNPQPTAPISFRDDAIAGSKELREKVGNALSNNFVSGAQQASEGWSELFHNQPLGLGKAALGAFNATAGNLLSTITGVVGDTATRLTGNHDFGEKAPLLIGTPILKVAAKSAPSVNALDKVVSHIAEGGPQSITNAVNALRSNPSLTAMDVSPAVETTAIAIAKGAPSTGQTKLFERAADRSSGAPEIIKSAYDTGMGATPNTVHLLQSFKDNARKVGQEKIQPALDATGPVDVTGVINHIDSKIDPYKLKALREGRPLPLPLTPTEEKLLEVRQNLTYRGKDELLPKRDEYFTDATGAAIDSGAHGVQSQIRREADTLSKSANGGERLVGGALGDVRNKIVDAIDRAGGGTAAKPGPYKQGLSAYRDEMDVQNAFDKGQEILSGARVGEKGMANRPEAFKAWVDGASEHEVAAARLGARTIVDNYIGTSRRAASAGRDLPEAPFTDAKLKMLFGEEEGNKILSTLRDEKRKAEVNTNLVRQSVTARALAGQREIAPREVGSVMNLGRDAALAVAPGAVADLLTGTGGAFSAATLGLGAVRKGYQLAGRSHDVAVANRYADIASSTEPKLRNALIQALEAKRAELSNGKKPFNALAASLGYLPSP